MMFVPTKGQSTSCRNQNDLSLVISWVFVFQHILSLTFQYLQNNAVYSYFLSFLKTPVL